MPQVLDVIGKGAAQSWQMDNRGKTMLAAKFDFGFAVDWMRKDLGLVLDEARRNGAQLPVTALVDQFYAEVQGMGGKRWALEPDRPAHALTREPRAYFGAEAAGAAVLIGAGFSAFAPPARSFSLRTSNTLTPSRHR